MRRTCGHELISVSRHSVSLSLPQWGSVGVLRRTERHRGWARNTFVWGNFAPRHAEVLMAQISIASWYEPVIVRVAPLLFMENLFLWNEVWVLPNKISFTRRFASLPMIPIICLYWCCADRITCQRYSSTSEITLPHDATPPGRSFHIKQKYSPIALPLVIFNWPTFQWLTFFTCPIRKPNWIHLISTFPYQLRWRGWPELFSLLIPLSM
jgi:hypothetical protein